jgi:hypothetical protein
MVRIWCGVLAKKLASVVEKKIFLAKRIDMVMKSFKGGGQRSRLSDRRQSL